MKPTIKKPAKKWESLEQRFLNYTLGGQQRQGKVITEAKGSNQFESMWKKIKQGY